MKERNTPLPFRLQFAWQEFNEVSLCLIVDEVVASSSICELLLLFCRRFLTHKDFARTQSTLHNAEQRNL